jgi:hypothetical protein
MDNQITDGWMAQTDNGTRGVKNGEERIVAAIFLHGTSGGQGCIVQDVMGRGWGAPPIRIKFEGLFSNRPDRPTRPPHNVLNDTALVLLVPLPTPWSFQGEKECYPFVIIHKMIM